MYEELKTRLTPEGGKMPFLSSIAASITAGVAGGLVGNPADIVNIR